MSGKSFVWIGMFVGSTVGSALPYLWGGGLFAYLIWSTVGAVVGIYLAFKLGKNIGML